MTENVKFKPLGDFIDLIMGQAPLSKECNFKGQGTPFVKVGEFSVERPVIREWTTKPLKLARRTDVLLCVVGATCGKINLGDECAIGRSVAALRPHPMKLNQYYLYYFMMTLIEALRSGALGAAQTVISKGMIESLLIPNISLLEQQRIVTILDEAFEGIATAKANAEKNLKNARALFDSYLNTVFSRRGDGWEEMRLGDICELITKGSSPKWQGIDYVDKPGVLFITSENVGEYQLLMGHPKFVEEAFNKKDRKSILRVGDVLTNIVGASIGRTAIFELEDVANINQAVCLIRCNSSVLNNYFLTYLLNSPFLKQVLHANEVNNARANLSLGFFSQLLVPLPLFSKQKEIVEHLDSLREETQRLEFIYQKKIEALDALKKSILHQAFTGAL